MSGASKQLPTAASNQRQGKGFQEKKHRILQSLNAGEEEYSDASPKGSVDAPIRPLLDRINAWEGLVTTSSCSGRISVFVEGPAKNPTISESQSDKIKQKEDEEQTERQRENARGGGKGGGRWLYTSHDSDEGPSWAADGVDKVAQALKMTQESLRSNTGYYGVNGTQQSIWTSTDGQSLVHFKFEPMILHVLTSSLTIAQRVLAAAQQAGFRESGISSATSDMPMVAIRTNGLALESLVGIQEDGQLKSIVDLSYLQLLFAVAETRFRENKLRITRLEELLSNAFSSDSKFCPEPAWEDAESRRVRKRAEGLARQAELHKQNGRDMNSDSGDDDVLNAGLSVP